MGNKLVFVLTLFSAFGCGLIGGVFFAFSNFVMKALTGLPPSQGIAAMKSINVTVLNPMFLGMFLGTAISCVILAVCSVLTWQKPGAALLLAGSALYLLGTLLVTIVCNVPRNDALAVLDPVAMESAQRWAEYVASWMFWNHVRTLAAIVASVLLTIALWLSSAHDLS